MKITREFNGKKIEIELTAQELLNAYYEQQNNFDCQDVEDWFNEFSDDELKDMYGMTSEELSAVIPEIAEVMRRKIEKYDMNWYDARDAAIAEKLR